MQRYVKFLNKQYIFAIIFKKVYIIVLIAELMRNKSSKTQSFLSNIRELPNAIGDWMGFKGHRLA